MYNGVSSSDSDNYHLVVVVVMVVTVKAVSPTLAEPCIAAAATGHLTLEMTLLHRLSLGTELTPHIATLATAHILAHHFAFNTRTTVHSLHSATLLLSHCGGCHHCHECHGDHHLGFHNFRILLV